MDGWEAVIAPCGRCLRPHLIEAAPEETGSLGEHVPTLLSQQLSLALHCGHVALQQLERSSVAFATLLDWPTLSCENSICTQVLLTGNPMVTGKSLLFRQSYGTA